MKCGIGIRPELFNPVFEQQPPFGFLEAHSENYFGESIARTKLLELREHYPISLHGVGLSLGRADNLNQDHLRQLKDLVDMIDPMVVSEHLAWSAYSHRHVPDLLPLPLTEQSLAVMCEHIDQMQTVLGRQILVENPSNYLLFDQLQIPEPEFLNTLAKRTGCGLLVDINNIHVSASNIARDGQAYINALNSDAIGQFHLAGYTEVERNVAGKTETVLIDTHNQTVYEPVWSLFEYTLQRHGVRPTLFEWDSDFPEFDVLLEECDKANTFLMATPHSRDSDPVPVDDQVCVQSVDEQELGVAQHDFLDMVFSQAKQLTTANEAHQHRIWIYQNNIFAATVDYLAEVFPATKGVLGEQFFKQIAQHFTQKMPPSEGNIHLYGGQLAQVFSEFNALRSMPYLTALVEYEWALHCAYFSKVSDSLSARDLPQDELLVMPIIFNDSVSLLSSNFPINEIHRQSLPSYTDEVSIQLEQSQDSLLVYKHNHKEYGQVVSEEEFALLKKIAESENLLQAIEALSGSISADTLSSTLALVFDANLLKAA